jgi:hypothetical protein
MVIIASCSINSTCINPVSQFQDILDFRFIKSFPCLAYILVVLNGLKGCRAQLGGEALETVTVPDMLGIALEERHGAVYRGGRNARLHLDDVLAGDEAGDIPGHEHGSRATGPFVDDRAGKCQRQQGEKSGDLHLCKS